MSKKSKKIVEDAELLLELSTLDEVTCWGASGADHDAGITPGWCEIVLEIKRTDDGTLTPAWPLNARLPLRRHDGELIIQVLHDVLHPGRPTSSNEVLWSMLDDLMEKIQRRVSKGKEPLKADAGQALGIATAIAVLDNPLEPDVDEVRSVAVERYEIRHGLSD